MPVQMVTYLFIVGEAVTVGITEWAPEWEMPEMLKNMSDIHITPEFMAG